MTKKLWGVAILLACMAGGCDEKDEANALIRTSDEPSIMLEGTSTDFMVRLTQKTNADVTINVTSSSDAFEVTPGTTIPQQTWSMAYILQISCVSDDVYTGDRTGTITLTASSADAAYNNQSVSFDVLCMDDETPGSQHVDPKPQPKPNPERTGVPGVTITPKSGLITSESGQTAEFSVVLTGSPLEDVIVPIASDNTAEGIVEPAQLVFTAQNWNVAQTVKITGVDDNVDDGNIVYHIELGPVQSKDDEYNNLEIADKVEVKNIDNDEFELERIGVPGVAISPKSGLVTSEDGQTAEFRVVLTGSPFEDVIVPVASDNAAEGSVEPSQLVFTAQNWNNAQTVKITGLDDSAVDGNTVYHIVLGPMQSDDESYSDLAIADTVEVTNIDNDIPDTPVDFTVSTENIQLKENGKPVSFTIVPTEKPIYDVVIQVTSTDETEASISPATLTFTPQNWNQPQTVTVKGKPDYTVDGDQNYEIQFDVASKDTRYDDYEIDGIQATTTDADAQTGDTIKLRVMAANITSGSDQGYCMSKQTDSNPCDGPGVRIFQALKPDIILINEFNMVDKHESNTEAAKFVKTTFGPEFTFARQDTSLSTHSSINIPNGIVSRYPIIDYGYWKSNIIKDRYWDWAVIDIPGPRDLLAVSVHLSTDDHAQEMPKLIDQIEAKIAADKKTTGYEYYVVIGGDFNTKSRNPAQNHFKTVFKVAAPYPADQKGNENTNAGRKSPYDWVLCSYDWCNNEVPVKIGSHTYNGGHVFDSRVYKNLGELSDVSPVLGSDSGASNMQHMAVIRDFEYTY